MSDKSLEENPPQRRNNLKRNEIEGPALIGEHQVPECAGGDWNGHLRSSLKQETYTFRSNSKYTNLYPWSD